MLSTLGTGRVPSMLGSRQNTSRPVSVPRSGWALLSLSRPGAQLQKRCFAVFTRFILTNEPLAAMLLGHKCLPGNLLAFVTF